MIIQDGDNLSKNIGRVTIAYVADRGVIRVVESKTGFVVREDEVGELSRQEFKEKAEYYEKLCRI